MAGNYGACVGGNNLLEVALCLNSFLYSGDKLGIGKRVSNKNSLVVNSLNILKRVVDIRNCTLYDVASELFSRAHLAVLNNNLRL